MDMITTTKTEYTIAELMTVCMAREINDGDKVLQGLYSPLPMAACLLARKTHAPSMVHLDVADAVNPDPDYLPFSTSDPKLVEGAVAIMDLCMVFDMAQQGRLDLVFLGAAQIDKFGNTNLTCIGDFEHPKVRLPGGAASAHLCATANRVVIWTVKHTPKVFVDKVDFITGQGFLDGPGSREKLGLQGGGPSKIITNLAVLGFDEKTKKVILESYHPWSSVEEVMQMTSFDLIIPNDVKPTQPPSKEQLNIMRAFDPQNVKEQEFRTN